MIAEIEIRHCRSLDEYKECVRLERHTWGEAITVPAAIFVVAEHSGGQILGAFDGGRLVGFTLGLAGLRESQHFIHSHMTAVLPEYQNRGVGRRLKLFQRQDALKRGIPLVEWTFDPLELKNAHFNLVRLGAIARRYISDCYGVTESPLHAGLPTDRLVAEWWIDSDRVKRILADDPLPGSVKSERIAIPSDVAEIKSKDRAAGERVQQEARAQFLELFEAGWVATSIESSGGVSSYILEPAGDISGLRLPEFHAH
ncbi:MAG TPA: GNAT family N-acetyltransferase [Candidatus Sulfotelmatobacter sp.]|nr:GNAT family N-acetyltransferase [Candidatus Sulfotelmatobacter sp.]